MDAGVQHDAGQSMIRPRAASTEPHSGVRRIVREPLLHFLIAGAIFCLIARHAPDGALSLRADRRIVWTEADVDRIRQSATIRLRRSPASDEMQTLIDDALRTEILSREAVRLGLDRDDPMVKARLAEKLDAVAEDGVLAEPTAAQLDAWRTHNRVRYMAPSRIDFEQVSFPGAAFGAGARLAAETALKEAGREAPVQGEDNAGLRFDYVDFTPQQVLPAFGPDFTERVFQMAPQADWQGPIQSTLGWHLVRIDRLERAPPPSAAELETAVRNDWIDYQRVEARRRFYADLRAHYEIVLPGTGGARP